MGPGLLSVFGCARFLKNPGRPLESLEDCNPETGGGRTKAQTGQMSHRQRRARIPRAHNHTGGAEDEPNANRGSPRVPDTRKHTCSEEIYRPSLLLQEIRTRLCQDCCPLCITSTRRKSNGCGHQSATVHSSS